MRITPIHTTRYTETQDLLPFIDRYVAAMPEYSILCVTSKIISIAQKRVVPKREMPLRQLIFQEAEEVYESTHSQCWGSWMTLAKGQVCLNAGIDASNAEGHYILLPDHGFDMAETIWNHLCARVGHQKLGVIVTDSRTQPFARGSVGRAIAWCGIRALLDYRGQKDMDGRLLESTQQNLVDAAAGAAVLVMGEGAECQPLALIEDAPHALFSGEPAAEAEQSSFWIEPKEDIYFAGWKRKV